MEKVTSVSFFRGSSWKKPCDALFDCRPPLTKKRFLIEWENEFIYATCY